MNTKKRGERAYLRFISKCSLNGWLILEPIGDSDRFDCVIDRGNGFEKVQVKTGRLRGGVILFNARSHCGSNLRSYRGDVELFGVYCFEKDTCYLIPVAMVGEVGGSLRVVPARNNQKQKIHVAKDFEI